MKKELLDVFKKQNSQTPIWIMRQAGRYLPEYRKVRESFPDFIEFCLTPEAACEVTIQPLKRFDLDAAILFSDILIIPYALGLNVKFKKDHGPIVEQIKNEDDLKKLSLNREVFKKVGKSVSLIKNELDKSYINKTLIGFAGAPWTVATYIIEGGGSKEFLDTKMFSLTHEKTFDKLIEIITDATIEYLSFQIEAGAEVVKIFDSWSGVLNLRQFKKYVVYPTQKIVRSLNIKFPNIKIIGFPRRAGFYLNDFANDVPVNGIAIDQFTPMDWALKNCNGKILQGNMDNFTMLGNKKEITNEVKNIFEKVGNKHFIFNLGHGILPQTPIDNMHHLVEQVRKYGS